METQERKISLYEKLTQARIELKNNTSLQKSGYNPNGRFKYYELQDFLPAVLDLMGKYKMLSNFSITDTEATLTILDAEGSEEVKFTSPILQIPTFEQLMQYELSDNPVMKNFEFKQLTKDIIAAMRKKTVFLLLTTAVQAAGAQITYMRRYLYMMAFEIVENDVFDAQQQNNTEQNTVTVDPNIPNPSAFFKMMKEKISDPNTNLDTLIEINKNNIENLLSEDKKQVLRELIKSRKNNHNA